MMANMAMAAWTAAASTPNSFFNAVFATGFMKMSMVTSTMPAVAARAGIQLIFALSSFIALTF